ncbi:hypothetical protein BP6252_00667 [Coleophoma cylindrospora]|uniref:Rho-GAP domain-containing protein n=1 Tax=Coleophoma cylindrospora TaxID=1849047 RepID=A0A3D8SQP6_9HELO|nr:hypothetical protein BP6252_00667 [Coleophoma cylindrospora]
MQSYSHAQYSRSSSAASHYARRPFRAQDGASDNGDIAQEMLNKPIIPPRKSSASPEKSADVSHSFQDTLELESGGRRRAMQSSNTWTSSSGGAFSDHDDLEDRTEFLDEYNRLAKKHNIPLLIPEEHVAINIDFSISANGKPGNWFSRNILRRSSSTLNNQTVRLKTEKVVRPRRSISDLSMRRKAKKDILKNKDLQELVRLCGISPIYMPEEYAVGGLAVPTCFRATAQYLVQHGPANRGVFRVPGAHNIVSALYSHYCSTDEDGDLISGTVRCPTLPDHIKCDVHDVASAFKKFLSGLPGGILGSLPLFDAFVSIHSQLKGDPEMTKTKQTKIRARLIALAIGTVQSQYRRDFICAVLGLLCMIGRAAETTRREDITGRPLPTSDLMGYGPLSVIFGPLLVGDLLENYTMGIANPHGPLVLFPVSPPKSRKDKYRKSRSNGDNSFLLTGADKIKIANSITEMLITHWRDVVRHLRDLGTLKTLRPYKSLGLLGKVSAPPFLRPSVSEAFIMRKPPDWDDNRVIKSKQRNMSPTPTSRRDASSTRENTGQEHGSELKIRKHRNKKKPVSTQMLPSTRSMSFLSPTAEETLQEQPSQPHATSHMQEIELGKDGVVTIKPDSLDSAFMTPSPSSSKLQKKPSQKAQLQKQDTPRYSGQPKSEGATALSPSVLMLKKNTRPVQNNSLQHLVEEQPGNTYHHAFATKENHPYLNTSMVREHLREPQQVLPSDPLRLSPTSQAAKARLSKISHSTRRLVESEPGPPIIRSPDRKGRPQTFDAACYPKLPMASPHSKDPLTEVSDEDDKVSLAKLAKALEVFEPSPGFEQNLRLEQLDSLSQIERKSNALAARIEEEATNTRVLSESITEQLDRDFESASSIGAPVQSKEQSPVQGSKQAHDRSSTIVTAPILPLSKPTSQKNLLQGEKVLPIHNMFEGLFKEFSVEHGAKPSTMSEGVKAVAIRSDRLGIAHEQELTFPNAGSVENRKDNRPKSKSLQMQVKQSGNKTKSATESEIENPAENTTALAHADIMASSVQYNHQDSLNGADASRNLPIRRRQSAHDSSNRNSILCDVSVVSRRAISPHRPPEITFIHSANDRKLVPPISRGGSVKALAAKFDTVASDPSASPTITIKNETPRKNIIASYTQNISPLPSPSKSQNSFRSTRSVRSRGSIPSVRNSNPLASDGLVPPKIQAAKRSPPRRLIRSSLDDCTPLRPVPATPTYTLETSANSPRNPSNPYIQPLEIGNSFCFRGEQTTEDMKTLDGHAGTYGNLSVSRETTGSATLISQVKVKTTMTRSNDDDGRSSRLQNTNNRGNIQASLLLPDTDTSPVGRRRSTSTNGEIEMDQEIQGLQDHFSKKLKYIENFDLKAKEVLKQGKVELAIELLKVNEEMDAWKKRAKAAEDRLETLEQLRGPGRMQKRWRTSSAPTETTSPLITFSEDGSVVDFSRSGEDQAVTVQGAPNDVESHELFASTQPLQKSDGARSTSRTEHSGKSQDTVIRSPLVVNGLWRDDEALVWRAYE